MMLQSPAVVICDYVGYNSEHGLRSPKNMNEDVVLDDDNAVDEAEVKARNDQTQDNRSSNQSMMKIGSQTPTFEGVLRFRKEDHNPS